MFRLEKCALLLNPCMQQCGSPGVEPIRLASHASATRNSAPATRSAIFNIVIIPTTSAAFVPTTIIQLAMSVTEIEQRCNILRHDLKVWEKKFAAENNGQKAGRDDIKANDDICMHVIWNISGPSAYRLQRTNTKSTTSFESN
jgi:hypothetical protein